LAKQKQLSLHQGHYLNLLQAHHKFMINSNAFSHCNGKEKENINNLPQIFKDSVDLMSQVHHLFLELNIRVENFEFTKSRKSFSKWESLLSSWISKVST